MKIKYGNLCTFHLQCGSNKRTYWSIFSITGTLSDLNWTNLFYFKFTSHTCTSVCAEPRVFVKSNSLWDWIVISACIFVKRWILGLQNVHAYIETDNRIHLVRGWGVVCKPKQFRLYILRCMENSIKIIVNWITFTSTLAIHLWLYIYIPTFTVRLFGTLHSHLKGFSY